MAVTFGSAAKANSASSGTTITIASLVIASTDTLLMVAVGNDATSVASISGVTFNGIAMTACGAQSNDGANVKNTSWWYQINPSVGTFSVVVTSATTITGAGAIAIPLAGADTTRAPVQGAGNSADPSTTPSCSVTGAGVNDLQLGATIVRSATITEPGGNQNVVSSTPTLPIQGINTGDSFACDYILGANAGNFTWTITNGNWSALGLTIFAPSTASVAWMRA